MINNHPSTILLLSGGFRQHLSSQDDARPGDISAGSPFSHPILHLRAKRCQSEARRVADTFHISIRTIVGGADYIQMVKNPRYGYGKSMNPCINCRIFIFKKARELMEEMGAQFIVTGEVLGERPMSQTLWAMKTIEKESGLDNLIVRPLSAQLLKPTIPEEKVGSIGIRF